MKTAWRNNFTLSISSFLLYSCAAMQPETKPMTFFVTSAGSGKGADLGGLAGADRQCQALAQTVGAGDRTWRAYLSVSASGSQPSVNARDRIGNGPWHNAAGIIIARDVNELHGKNNLTKQTALNEKGEPINGRGDKPNMHDILTGSQPDGRAFLGNADMTCSNWTSSSAGAAMLGHHDRQGLTEEESSWNSAHPSRGEGGGCSQTALRGSGGNGLFYCFAIN